MKRLSMNGNAERRRALLRRKMAELDGSADRDLLQVEVMADELDQVRLNADRELALQRLDTKARIYRQIGEALRKIDEGTYGVCENCEQPIASRRLEAVPWAPLCVACQAKAEAMEHPPELRLDLAA